MNKNRCFWLLALALFFAVSYCEFSEAAAIENGFMEWKGTVAPFEDIYKPWNIKFSAPILEDDIRGDYPQNIYITDVGNVVVPANLRLSADGTTVTLTPKESYIPGTDYRLYISNELRDHSGNRLSQSLVMPFKASPTASDLDGKITIVHSGELNSKDREIILDSPDKPPSKNELRRLAATPSPEDFEYCIKYVAQVMPVSVDNVSIDGVSQSVTVQANDIFIAEDKAFVSYNYRGAVFAGAIQIIDISDAVHPQVLQEIKFNNMDINAVYYDSATGQLLFGGGVEPGVVGSGHTSFIARVNVDDIQVADIINSMTALPSNCLTSICKKGDHYYVGVGAANGAIVVFDSNMHQIDGRNIEDVRDIKGYDQGFVALAGKFPSGSSDATGKLISSLTDSSSDIIISPFDSPEHKSTIDLAFGGEKILGDEDALVFMALANEGFRVVKMGGEDYCNQVVYELPNPIIADGDSDNDTVGVSYDGGLVFLANGHYGFQVLRLKGLSYDNIDAAFIDPQNFAELLGYHKLTGSIYDGQYFHANNIAYSKRVISQGGCPQEQNLLFVAVGEGGVNIYTLSKDIDNINPHITSLQSISATVQLGDAYLMPAEVTANMSDGSSCQVPVQWTPSQIDTSSIGIKEASGVVADYDGLAQLLVTVTTAPAACPDLDKIFAVGLNNDGKAIELTGSSTIHGNTAVNSVLDESVSFEYSSFLKEGDLYIGPDADPAAVVSFNGYGRNAETNIPNGAIKNLDAIRDFPLPNFPDFPTFTLEQTMDAGWHPIPEGGFRISSDGQYSTIEVSNQLTIDIGDEDRIIRTGSLSVLGNGHIVLDRTGQGKLILYVENNLEITGSSSINQNGDYNSVIIYYKGSELNVGGNTAVVASLFAESADIEISGSGGFKGHILTGGTVVNVTGNARANVRAIYAPQASLKLSGSSEIEGAIIARDIKLLGNSHIYYNDNINIDFFNLLTW